ncbi:unnamed protein product [Urochloa humidicola]
MAIILSSAAPTPLTPPARPRRQRQQQPPRAAAAAAARGLHWGLARLSAALGLSHAGAALAVPLTYEEALRLSTDSGGDGGELTLSIPDLGLPDLGLDGLVDFVTENPVVVAASVAAVGLPVLLGQLLGGGGASKPYAVVPARAAYQRLLEEPGAQLLDIRPLRDAREAGKPDLSEAKKKPAAVPYNGEDKNGFLKKLALRFKDPENTTLVILDKFDGNSELVAELVTANGFKAAFAVKDGAEGSRGWKSSNLPWKEPAKGFSFDLGELLGDGSDSLPLTIGLAAATGLGVLAYTEIETLLQFLGSAAVVQLVATKFLYAEDRQKTLKQIDEFLNKKVAPKDLVDEIKEIGQALLPLPGEAKSQPALETGTPAAATATGAPAEATTESAPTTPTPLSPYSNYPDLKPPSPPSAPSNLVEEASTESRPARPKPLSPYPNYPDLKPPSSPSPSPP